MIVLLGAAAGFVASLQFPVQYAARAELVYLIGQEEPTGFLREDRNLTTQVILLRSRSVLEPVAATEGLTVKGLDEFQVELVEGSEVIRLEVRDESREAGQAILTQIIDRYTTVSRDIAPAETRAYLQTQLEEVRRRLAEPSLEGSERGALTERETTLLAQVDSLNLAGAQVKVVVAPYSAPGSREPAAVARWRGRRPDWPPRGRNRGLGAGTTLDKGVSHATSSTIRRPPPGRSAGPRVLMYHFFGVPSPTGDPEGQFVSRDALVEQLSWLRRRGWQRADPLRVPRGPRRCAAAQRSCLLTNPRRPRVGPAERGSDPCRGRSSVSAVVPVRPDGRDGVVVVRLPWLAVPRGRRSLRRGELRHGGPRAGPGPWK